MERPGIVPDARGWGCTCLRSDPGRVMVYPCVVPAPPAAFEDFKIRGLEARDFDDAFEKIRSPITADEIDRYEEWNRNFGE